MAESMIERVARAIMVGRGGCEVTDWREAEWNPHVSQALIEARAAIKAMREPTFEMQVAGRDNMLDGDMDVDISTEDFRFGYRTAIDTALEEAA